MVSDGPDLLVSFWGWKDARHTPRGQNELPTGLGAGLGSSRQNACVVPTQELLGYRKAICSRKGRDTQMLSHPVFQHISIGDIHHPCLCPREIGLPSQ